MTRWFKEKKIHQKLDGYQLDDIVEFMQSTQRKNFVFPHYVRAILFTFIHLIFFLSFERHAQTQIATDWVVVFL